MEYGIDIDEKTCFCIYLTELKNIFCVLLLSRSARTLWVEIKSYC